MHINYLYLHFAGCYSFYNISLLTKRPGHAALMADRSILDQVQKLQQIVFRGLLMSFVRYSRRWLCLRFFVPLHRHMNLVDAMVNLFAIIFCVVVLDERGSPAHITIQSSSVFSPSCLWKAGGSNETEKNVSSVHQVECNYLNSDPPWYHTMPLPASDDERSLCYELVLCSGLSLFHQQRRREWCTESFCEKKLFALICDVPSSSRCGVLVFVADPQVDGQSAPSELLLYFKILINS